MPVQVSACSAAVLVGRAELARRPVIAVTVAVGATRKKGGVTNVHSGRMWRGDWSCVGPIPLL